MGKGGGVEGVVVVGWLGGGGFGWEELGQVRGVLGGEVRSQRGHKDDSVRNGQGKAGRYLHVSKGSPAAVAADGGVWLTHWVLLLPPLQLAPTCSRSALRTRIRCAYPQRRRCGHGELPQAYS